MSLVSFFRDENGKWNADGIPSGTNPDYASSFLDTLNEIGPIFEKAKAVSEFYFVFSLLSVQSPQDVGWDAHKTIIEAKKGFSKAQERLQYIHNSKAYFALFLYGLIVEASEYYERLGNLLEISTGKSYRTDVVTSEISQRTGRVKQLYPIQKIEKLKELAESAGFNLGIFDTFFDNKLRNAIFHSDFVLHGKEIRTLNPDCVYSEKEILRLFNRALGYSDAFDFLIDGYKKEYDKPTKIPVADDFWSFPGEMAQVIVREKSGLVGIKADCQSGDGQINWRLARPLKYEQKMIDDGRYNLPENRFDRLNKIISLFPYKMRPFLVGLIRSNKFFDKWLGGI